VNNPKPLSYLTITRILIFLLISTALIAGLYRTKLLLLQKEYALVENRYVRVRDMLGREATQDLINKSYQIQGVPLPNSEVSLPKSSSDSSSIIEIDSDQK